MINIKKISKQYIKPKEFIKETQELSERLNLYALKYGQLGLDRLLKEALERFN